MEAARVFARLRELHPDAHCELDHASAFQLLVATVLSAQTTDKLVNKVTPALFARYPDAPALGAAEPDAVAELLRTGGLGMYNQKGKNIVGLARKLVADHGGEVPRSMDALTALPGVGRKTANVVLGVIWGSPEGVVVDTHVQRLSQRLGFTEETKPETIERDLCALFPREAWDPLSHTLIFHGRRVCFAVKPACAGCGAAELCPSAFHAEEVGRKPGRARAPDTARGAPSKGTARKATAAKATAAKAASKSSASKSSASKSSASKSPASKSSASTSEGAASKSAASKRATAAKSAPTKRITRRATTANEASSPKPAPAKGRRKAPPR
jgi:endonuclease-3